MARSVGVTPAPIALARFAAQPDLLHAITAWQEWLTSERRASPHTVAAYGSDLAQFLDFIAEHRGGVAGLAALEALTPADFRAFLAARAGAQIMRSSSARAMSVLRGFFRFLDRRDLVKSAALIAVRTPKLPKSLPRALSIEEAQDALERTPSLARLPWEGLRNLAIFMLLYGGGLRIGEALSLKRREAPMKAGAITILGKGNKTRLVPVLAEVATAIRDYLAVCPHDLAPDDPLFVGARGKVLNPRQVQGQIGRAHV
jgi:integrase/recombinase XerC